MQYVINFKDNEIICHENETILNAFFRQQIDVPFSCRKGSCQVCTLKVLSGHIPQRAQRGLSQKLIQSGHFLPCQCQPVSHMTIEEPLSEERFITGVISQISQLNDTVSRVHIDLETIKNYQTGQFINVKPSNTDWFIRSYSISNCFNQSNSISIDVQLLKSGVFSNWIFSQAKSGDLLDIQMPLGESFHTSDLTVDSKLIVTSGSGLGVGLAIVLEALNMGYSGLIKLCQYAQNHGGLYHQKLINSLMKKHSNFFGLQFQGDEYQNMPEWVFSDEKLKQQEMYIFGNKKLINDFNQLGKDHGLNPEKIIFDSFDFKYNCADQSSLQQMNGMEFIEEPTRTDTIDNKMWQALGEGKILRTILENFYQKVFTDELLSPFFKGVTENHVIGKQYAFMAQCFMGGDGYFGDRPRNAHHWMVISNELFNHRENLFKQSCIDCGLQDPFLGKILDFNERFRNVIVKNRVWPRIAKGVIKPIKGFDELELSIGAICDHCRAEIEPITKVKYHTQTGEIFCPECYETPLKDNVEI